MEGQVWGRVEELLSSVDGKPPRCQYSDREILRVTLWAIIHDRPIVGACEPAHWSDTWRPEALPDPSTVSRRWKWPELQEKAYALHAESVRRLGVASRYAAIDGRPLPVGGCSKDPDARCGRAARGMGKGYKMHALVDMRHVILAYMIRPMNEAEQTVALPLVSKAPAGVTRLVGDGIYDSIKLHQAAEATGRKLYTPLRENRVGRRQQPRRLHLWRLGQRSAGHRRLKSRDEIERTFGQTSTISFGFKGLPAWARRSHRVFRWMWGKNLIHHAWLLTKPRAA
jgi:IS5 family transposase